MTLIFSNEIKQFESKAGKYFKLAKDIYFYESDNFISSGEIIRCEDIRVRNDGKSQWSEFDNYRLEIKVNNIDFGIREIKLSIYDVKNIKDIEDYFKSIFQKI